MRTTTKQGVLTIISSQREFGDYQTPPDFAHEICSLLKHELCLDPEIIVEPTCGVGSLLKAALIFGAQDLYGVEINPEYCQQCLSDSALKDQHLEIINADFFNYDFGTKLKNKRVLALGNPPWITNSTLATLGSHNLPHKTNFRALKGIEALTGASNFDICEDMILKLVALLSGSDSTVAMLCKRSVARKVFGTLYEKKINCSYVRQYDFNARQVFGVDASACLFVIKLSSQEHQVPTMCSCYEDLSTKHSTYSYGYDQERFYSTLKSAPHDFEGHCCFNWRQGVKHDCAKIMELTSQDRELINGLNERVVVESKQLFPLVKSSMLTQPILCNFAKFVLITQRNLQDDTSALRTQAPKTWAYLTNHQQFLARRKSSIYRGKCDFAMFGIGDYAFARYKVGLSGFYYELKCSLVYDRQGKSVMLDDTCYFLGFERFADAYVAMLYLNSPQVKQFLQSMAFVDAKRPYTKKLLERLSFSKIVAAIDYIALKDIEHSLGLKSYVKPSMVKHFALLVKQRDSTP